MEDDLADVMPRRGLEDDEDSERDEDERDWVVWDEEEEEEVVVDSDTHLSKVDTPPERSGHIAVVDGNFMYVWGGYKVCFQVRLKYQGLTLFDYYF